VENGIEVETEVDIGEDGRADVATEVGGEGFGGGRRSGEMGAGAGTAGRGEIELQRKSSQYCWQESAKWKENVQLVASLVSVR
jgi:hypothetical protein